MDKLNFKVWFESKEEKKNKIRGLLDGQNLILFFKKGDSLFGAPEESRLVFAKMKSPDEDTPDGWADDANFAAFDLMKALMGDRVESIFGKKDLKAIDVIEPEEAENMLMQTPDVVKNIITNFKPIKQSKYGLGMLKLKDKK